MHAGLESGIHLPQDRDDTSSLVLCGISSEDELLAEHRRLIELGIDVILFREPDLDNQATALASGAISGPDRQHFRHHKLWTGQPKDSHEH